MSLEHIRLCWLICLGVLWVVMLLKMTNGYTFILDVIKSVGKVSLTITSSNIDTISSIVRSNRTDITYSIKVSTFSGRYFLNTVEMMYYFGTLLEFKDIVSKCYNECYSSTISLGDNVHRFEKDFMCVLSLYDCDRIRQNYEFLSQFLTVNSL